MNISSNTSSPLSSAHSNEYNDTFLSFEAAVSGFLSSQTSSSISEDELSWRMDPKLSHSDWTIIINSDEGDETTHQQRTYHVHKAILSVGKNKSDYFGSVFRSEPPMKETSTDTSEITLPGLAFQAFEHLLDFFYEGFSPELHKVDELSVWSASVDEMVGLRYLSQYFSVRALFTKVSSAILERLQDTDVLLQFLTAAYSLNDDKLVTKVADTCAANLETLIERSEDFVSLLPALAVQIFASSSVKCESELLSRVVANYCEAHCSEIDGDFLSRVARRIPRVDFKVAPFFINLSSMLQGGDAAMLEDFRDRCREACGRKCGIVATSVGSTPLVAELSPQLDAQISKPYSSQDWKENYKLVADAEKVKILETSLQHGHAKNQVLVAELMALQEQYSGLARQFETAKAKHREAEEAYDAIHDKYAKGFGTVRMPDRRDMNNRFEY
jgi:hypothetical protein